MSNGYVTRNFAAHGGNEWVIGGKLTFVEGAEIEGLSEALASAPLFTPVANQADICRVYLCYNNPYFVFDYFTLLQVSLNIAAIGSSSSLGISAFIAILLLLAGVRPNSEQKDCMIFRFCIAMETCGTC